MGPKGQSTGIVRSRNAVDAADRGKVGDVRAQIPVTMSRNCYAFMVFLFNGTPVVVSDCKIRNHLCEKDLNSVRWTSFRFLNVFPGTVKIVSKISCIISSYFSRKRKSVVVEKQQ